MPLTEHALNSMGYTPLPDGSVLRGTFTRIYVVEVRGFTMEAPALAPVSGRLHGTRFSLCVGNSLNALFREVTGDEFGDEEHWRKEKRSSPPFVIVKLGPTQEHIGTVKHFKASDDRIQCYEGFNAAKSELDNMADAVVPALMTSLTLGFYSRERPTRFIEKDVLTVGRTSDGRYIDDWRLDFRASMYVSRRLEEADIKERLLVCLKNGQDIPKRGADAFRMASEDGDPLKRFLLFFFFVERLTHAVFKAADRNDPILRHLNFSTLSDRFVWCALRVWTHLTDSDVMKFKELKQIRDKIAHGELSIPDSQAVEAIEELATRLWPQAPR